ncbi:hypothetical protein UFOVP97_28 [uncultured Caudovirales phage]|uniref:Uncharacterized protein n=1 Tax=uncultured Caudovirales phage TaxID=2100421 RepID=A0A6J5LIF0_9CAUD|nr:hypothetical protein UFOVP97_28 [uncultured Caudovirales phage]CAB4134344.1 hypothetical protein UFOVP268_46 [uncultured Caudovirales phage]
MADFGKREKKFLKAKESERLKILRNAPAEEKQWYLDLLASQKGEQSAQTLAKKINFEKYFNANRGKGSLGATWNKGQKGGGEPINIPQELPKETQDYKDLLLKEAQIGLPGLLQQLRTPYQSPMNQQVEGIFGHLQNPILQNLLNPDQRFAAGRSLFPSEIENEYQQMQQQQPSAIGSLLSSLGKHYYETEAVPWLQKPENLQWLGEQGIPQAYNQASNYGNQAYDYAKNSRAGQGIGDILEYLGAMKQGFGRDAEDIGGYLGMMGQGLGQDASEYADFFRGIPGLAREGVQSFGQSFQNPELYGGIPARAYQGVQSGLGGLQNLGRFAKTLPGEAYNDISSLLSKLGSYLPSRNKGA